MLHRPAASIVISPAAARMPWPKGVRQRYQKRRRLRAFRQREKDDDRLRCYSVWLHDTDVVALLNDAEVTQQRGDQFTPREVSAMVDKQWTEMVGGVIAKAALLAIRKNRK